MFKNILLSLIALFSFTAPAYAEAQKTITVIADNREVCGNYRLAMHKRQDNEDTARKVAYEYEKLGYKTKVVVLSPGSYVGYIPTNTPVYTVNPTC